MSRHQVKKNFVCDSDDKARGATLAELAAKLVRMDMDHYTQPKELAALRAGLGTAAAICDLMEQQIKKSNTSRSGARGRVTDVGLALADVAKRCGDEVWAARDLISVTTDDPLYNPPVP